MQKMATTKVTQLSTILEIEVPRNRDGEFRRYETAIQELRQSRIMGFPVVAVHTYYDGPPTYLEGFGHDARCERREHKCRKRPYGIARYFNVTVFVAGNVRGQPATDILRRYRIDETAEIEIASICGKTLPATYDLPEVR